MKKDKEDNVEEKKHFNIVTIILIILIVVICICGILEITTKSISKGVSNIKNWYLKLTESVSLVRKYTWKY